MIQRLLSFLLAAFLSATAWAQTKQIRLRTETITTVPRSTVARATVPDPTEPTVSGLYLIQFQSRPDPTLRATLESQGIELLNFVPDDAWVARLRGNRLSEVRSLPEVRWVGPFEPRHKLDPRLARDLSAGLAGNRPVKLLVAPGVSRAEMALVQRHLQGSQPRITFHLGTTFQGLANAASLRVLAQSPAVLWMEPAPKMKLVDQVSTEIVAGEPMGQGHLAYVHELGFDGRGVTVAVADSGIDSGDITFLHPDLDGRVEALFAYDELPDASDEHSHGTHCAGIVLGNAATGEMDDFGYLYGLGVAPGARLVGQRMFDAGGEYRPPPSFAKLTQDAVRSGAYVGSNSWGDDTGGQYDLSAAEFDALVRDADPEFPGEQPYILEFSAGNAGPGGQTIGSPAVAKNVIATGATQNNRFEFPLYGEGQEVMADFSSRGPAEDGRIKPDLVAPGTWIASLRSIFANDNNAWGPISGYYLYQGGTSQAGPHVAGAAAVAVQWYRQMHGGATPSPALVKAMLINSADDMSTAVIPDTGDIFGGEPDEWGEGIVVGDTGPVPNHDEGWGRLNLVNLIDSERRFEFVEQGAGLATGQFFQTTVVVGAEDQLKVTLVYTDAPGLPAAIPALVNDLDLEVVAPNGDVYRGNAFAEGESFPGTPEGDRINNVEAVHLEEPAAGEWIIRVVAHNVVKDVHQRSIAAPEQDFALAISGQLPAPGEGVVSWDREAYRAPTTATLRLVDLGLTENAVTVQVSSSTEPAGLPVTLTRGGNTGTFVGTVAIVSGPANAGDDALSAQDGDQLVAIYQDAEPAGERRATARLDAQPPLISEVQSASQFGRTTVTWLTSEPTTASVWFGTTNAVTNVVSDLGLRTRQRLPLPVLNSGETYFFLVVSTDAAGNSTTNDNGGRFFRFIAPRPANALLVYSPESLFAEGGLLSETPYPEIETWTDTLTALDLDYEVWNIGDIGRAPTAAELVPYRVVLWRPEELQGPAPGITSALTSYVGQGGSLFVASFDLLSRLTEAQAGSFITNVLHVSSFEEDGGAWLLTAVPGDPVGGGKAFDLNYDDFPSGFIIDILGITWEDGPDHLNAATNTATTFLQEDGRAVGVRYPRTGQDSTSGRVVFTAVGLESIPADGMPPNNRASFVADALRFLAPDLIGGSSLAFDQSAYTVPGSVVLEATDSQQAGVGKVSVTVESGTTTHTLDLAETVRPGVFRGRLTLVPPDAVQDPGRLPATHGGVVRATYVDAASRTVQTESSVDTQPPTIGDVTSDPSYNEAYILWTTDKPTDALVRFGESGGNDSFLTRTAYSAELALEHEVLIRGLLPNRTYYFQVISRDAAGNLTRDNNEGRQYTVNTLAPLEAPWSDDLEERQPGWAVYNDDAGAGVIFPGDDEDDGGGGLLIGTGWRWGVPNNPAGVTARSGGRVWSTNLRGENVDFGISDLISPAISLVGGNRATLRFWQYYDFSVSGGWEDDPFGDFVIELAQVALSTDNGATWRDLYAVTDEVSFDWEEVEVDLSRYLGSVIRLRFNYQLFAFVASPRLGWMLDDIAVEMITLPESTLTVSNNLAQAEFLISGPVEVSGAGLSLRTNIPPGDYVVRWQPVVHYVTPAPQTNTLVVGTPLTVVGHYTFPDANSNGISDTWEAQYFGEVIPGYTGEEDTDGDGVSDAKEWQAGTDPLEVASRFWLDSPVQLPDGRLRFEWNTIAGHEYRLETSNDLVEWLPAAAAVRATGAPLSATIPTLDPRLPFFFRIVVIP